MPTILIVPQGWSTAPTGGGGTGGGTGGGGTGGGSVAPDKSTWQPVLVGSATATTQVGPNGQYSLNPFDPNATSGPTALTNRSGNLTLNTNNVTWIGVNFLGMVSVGSATGNIFYSCRFRGQQSDPGSTSLNGSVFSNFTTNAVVLYDCWLDPTYRNADTGMIGGFYTLWRCDIWRSIDGCGPRNFSTSDARTNAYHYNCYIHDLCAMVKNPSQHRNGVTPGPSHNDCIQFQGGNNCEVIGCSIMGFCDPTFGDGATWNTATADSGVSGHNGVREFGPAFQINSCIQTNQNNGKAISSGFIVNYNYFDGGAPASCNISNLTGAFSKTIVDSFVGNRFGHNQGGYLAGSSTGYSGFSANDGGNNTYTNLSTSGTTTVTAYSDNKYADTLVAVVKRIGT